MLAPHMYMARSMSVNPEGFSEESRLCRMNGANQGIPDVPLLGFTEDAFGE
jgi:hypothetical protein